MVWKIACILLGLLALSGCGGKNPGPEIPTESKHSPNPLAVTTPADMLADLPARTTSAILTRHEGFTFEQASALRVTNEVPLAVFEPNWTGSDPENDELAIAFYRFNLEGFIGENTLTLAWAEPPGTPEHLWVGIGNWEANRWEWYPSDLVNDIDFSDIGQGRITHAETEDMLVAVALLGTQTASLEYIQVGPSNLSRIRITGVTPEPVEGDPGDEIVLGVEFTGTNDFSTTFKWSFGNGLYYCSNRNIRNPVITLRDPGAGVCIVTVDNRYGEADVFEFTVMINDIEAECWPMFGHDAQHTRRSPLQGPQEPNLSWQFETGAPVLSSPCVSIDGSVYFGSTDHHVYSLNTDGSLKWSYETGDEVVSSPAIGADGRIHIYANDGNLYSFLPDGTGHRENSTDGGVGFSPVIDTEGRVYYGFESNNLFYLTANGARWWAHTINEDLACLPAIDLDDHVLIADQSYALRSYHYMGWLQWTHTATEQLTSSPAIDGVNAIYIGHGNNLLALSSDGEPLWEYETAGLVQSGPGIRSDGSVVFGSDDGKVYALGPDGSLLWSYQTGDTVQSSPAIDGEDSVYIGSTDGYIYALNADGSVKWTYLTGGGVSSSPAIGPDGNLYVGSRDGYLYAFSSDSGN